MPTKAARTFGIPILDYRADTLVASLTNVIYNENERRASVNRQHDHQSKDTFHETETT